MLNSIRFLYSWLLPPGLIILFFLVSFLLFLQTKRKLWFVLPVLLMYLLSVSAVSDHLIRPLETMYPQAPIKDLQQAQAIVILGGGAHYFVPDFNGKGQVAPDSVNRYVMGLRLQRVLHLPVIISGSLGEALYGTRLLKSCGLEDKFILKETKSRNTANNAKYTKEFCVMKGYQKLILVTSAHHLPRSVLLFQREGVDVIPYPADYRTHANTYYLLSDFTPSYDSMSNSALALKEYLGIVAVKMGWQ